MAKKRTTIPQSYPRIEDEKSRYHGLLDTSKLKQHYKKIPIKTVQSFIKAAIVNANLKSSRSILKIPEGISRTEEIHLYKNKGKDLVKYFKKYCGDPAASAFDTMNRHYTEICNEQFRNRTLQKERMNSGWRYQFLARDCAQASGRFEGVSDIGGSESDFNAKIDYLDISKEPLSLYVSIKNRANTMGGQDWPKAISALEEIARLDKNRTAQYCCIFGITMDRGTRNMRREQKSGNLYSVNTEIWLSDFFWPFFSNFTYEEIMNLVLETLLEVETDDRAAYIELPLEFVDSFGDYCRELDLINEDGIFYDPFKLVKFFCKK